MNRSIEQALNTKKAEIVRTRDFQHNGNSRKAIYARRANGSKVYMIVKYENGTFSNAVGPF